MVKDGLSEVAAFAANVANNEKHCLLEFAMRYFQEGCKKFDFSSLSLFFVANQTFSGILGNISWQIQVSDVFHHLLCLQLRLRLKRGRLPNILVLVSPPIIRLQSTVQTRLSETFSAKTVTK